LAGPIVAEKAITHLAAAAAPPLAADVFGTPLPHTREIGDEVVDGLRGGMDLDTGFAMHTMDSHARSPRCKGAHGLRHRRDFLPLSRLCARLSRVKVSRPCLMRPVRSRARRAEARRPRQTRLQ